MRAIPCRGLGGIWEYSRESVCVFVWVLRVFSVTNAHVKHSSLLSPKDHDIIHMPNISLSHPALCVTACYGISSLTGPKPRSSHANTSVQRSGSLSDPPFDFGKHNSPGLHPRLTISLYNNNCQLPFYLCLSHCIVWRTPFYPPFVFVINGLL